MSPFHENWRNSDLLSAHLTVLSRFCHLCLRCGTQGIRGQPGCCGIPVSAGYLAVSCKDCRMNPVRTSKGDIAVHKNSPAETGRSGEGSWSLEHCQRSCARGAVLCTLSNTASGWFCLAGDRLCLDQGITSLTPADEGRVEPCGGRDDSSPASTLITNTLGENVPLLRREYVYRARFGERLANPALNMAAPNVPSRVPGPQPSSGGVVRTAACKGCSPGTGPAGLLRYPGFR